MMYGDLKRLLFCDPDITELPSPPSIGTNQSLSMPPFAYHVATFEVGDRSLSVRVGHCRRGEGEGRGKKRRPICLSDSSRSSGLILYRMTPCEGKEGGRASKEFCCSPSSSLDQNQNALHTHTNIHESA